MTWDNALESYKTYLILEKSLANNSIEAYLNDIRKLIKFCIYERHVDEPENVTYEQLKEFLVYTTQDGTSARTQARLISSIRSFFKFLVYDGRLSCNPARLVEAPKIGRRLPSTLTVKEIDAMIQAADLRKPDGQRNRAIIEMLYSCGLRVSELTSLKISNINFNKNIIKVEGKGNKERLIPLSNRAKQEIKQYMPFREQLDIAPEAEDILFLNKRGGALSRVMIFNIIKQLTFLAGIRKNVSPHTLRHSFASHLVTGGADLRAVQDMLGHESILTTEIYTHLDDKFLKETMEKYHPRSKNNINHAQDE